MLQQTGSANRSDAGNQFSGPCLNVSMAYSAPGRSAREWTDQNLDLETHPPSAGAVVCGERAWD